MAESQTSERARVTDFFRIRDATRAGAITSTEATFLYVVASHGRAWGSAASLAKEMGVGRTTFYATRDRLVEKGFLRAEERPRSTTVYEIRPQRLRDAADPRTACQIPAGGVSETDRGCAGIWQGGVSETGTQEETLEAPVEETRRRPGAAADDLDQVQGTVTPLDLLKARGWQAS